MHRAVSSAVRMLWLAVSTLAAINTPQAGAAEFQSADRHLTVALPGLNAGPVYSSLDAGLRSYVRFTNTSSAAGTVTAALYDVATGAAVGTWTSPPIPAGSQQEYYIGELETGLAPEAVKPARYTLAINATFAGFFQHVLWSPAESILSNLTACSSGIGNDPLSVSGVRSSRISSGYASTLIARNAGDAPIAAIITIYDASTGYRLGSFTTGEIPANAALALDVAALETGARVVPGPDTGHYVVKADPVFTGFLQHVVTNRDAGGTITDMTRQCALDGVARGRVTLSAATVRERALGMAYPSSAAGPQSVLRVINTLDTPGTITVTLRDLASGRALGTWTSPPIPAGVSEFPISVLESALEPGTARPAVYTLTLVPEVTGYAQNLIIDAEAGTLTNVSSCSGGLAGNVITASAQAGAPQHRGGRRSGTIDDLTYGCRLR